MRTTIALAVLLVPTVALAVPIVKGGGEPGAATSWASKKDAVVLEIGADYDASEVASAIEKKVPGSSAKAKGSSVIVTGVAQDKLLAALAQIEVEPSMDDIDEMLTELRKPGDDEGSGSSIRATQAADFSDVMGEKEALVEGKIVAVEHHRFPMVVVTVKIGSVAAGVKGVKKGQTVKVIPRVKSRNGVIDPEDKTSKLNVGAWYAVKGDAVRLRFEGDAPRSDSIWIAAAFQRK
jgi:hypothetical protein